MKTHISIVLFLIVSKCLSAQDCQLDPGKLVAGDSVKITDLTIDDSLIGRGPDSLTQSLINDDYKVIYARNYIESYTEDTLVEEWLEVNGHRFYMDSMMDKTFPGDNFCDQRLTPSEVFTVETSKKKYLVVSLLADLRSSYIYTDRYIFVFTLEGDNIFANGFLNPMDVPAQENFADFNHDGILDFWFWDPQPDHSKKHDIKAYSLYENKPAVEFRNVGIDTVTEGTGEIRIRKNSRWFCRIAELCAN
jgi:hypothetical protein